jgi:hypothetical protein
VKRAIGNSSSLALQMNNQIINVAADKRGMGFGADWACDDKRSWQLKV